MKEKVVKFFFSLYTFMSFNLKKENPSSANIHFQDTTEHWMELSNELRIVTEDDHIQLSDEIVKLFDRLNELNFLKNF
jgi:hypothetical protein